MDVLFEVYELRLAGAGEAQVGLRQIVTVGDEEQVGGYLASVVLPRSEAPFLGDRYAGTLAPVAP